MIEGLDWLDLRRCGTCGKKFSVLYPQLWRYKREKQYFCSWKCLRKHDGKEADEMGERRDRIEIAKAIIENGKAGKPVTETLAEMGYKNPGQAAHDIKKYIREKQPALYDQWPVRVRGKTETIGETEKAEEQVDAYLESLIREEAATIGETEKAEEPVKAPDLKMAPVPEPVNRLDVKLIPDDFQITGIRGKAGEYTHDTKHGTVDLRTPDGQELSLLTKEWAQLAEEIGRMLKILEVE